LHLNNNQLSGSIPSSLLKLTRHLHDLFLSNNQLSGSIPSWLGEFPNLQYLYLDGNQLSGSIPSSLGKLTIMLYLFLNDNQLSGSIPSSLGNLTYLYYLCLDNNRLSGSIPRSLGNLKELRYLDLSNNQLSHIIPPALGNLTQLQFLHLDSNQLSERIPAELGNLTYLHELNLKDNNLRDSIPSSFGNLTNLTSLDLSQNNNLSGTIPASLSNLQHLRFFSINNDKFEGAVPVFLSSLPQLDTLEILFNYFNFDGIETLAQHNFEVFEYFNQKKINIHLNNNILSVYAGGTLSNNTYKWYRDGALAATITGDSTFTPTGSGIYNVEVTNSVATKLTLKSDTVTFSGLTNIAQNDLSSSLGTNKTSFSIYPNPAKTTVTVKFNAAGNCTLKLTDATGTVLQTKTITAIKGANNILLDVSRYATGVYFVTLSDEKNQTQTLQLNKL
jgi:hypothetical protein